MKKLQRGPTPDKADEKREDNIAGVVGATDDLALVVEGRVHLNGTLPGE